MRLGSQVAVLGKAATLTVTTSSAIQYGMAPRNISPTVMLSSGRAAFTVNTSIPNGGVSSPASIASIPTMANASGSSPIATAIGTNTGTVISMIEIESMMQPSTNQISTISDRIAQGGSPESTNSAWVAPVTPVIDSTRA